MRRILPNRFINTGNHICKHLIRDIDTSPIPEYDYAIDMENTKSVEQYVKHIESIVRGSYEYKRMINVLKEDFNMTECAIMSNVKHIKDPDSPNRKGPRIEIHHEPFSLFDIVLIVFRKRVIRGEDIRPLIIAEEVLYLHSKGLAGLIPLSVTLHKLVHNGELFIGSNFVSGRPDLFYELYNKYIPTEIRDVYINNIANSGSLSSEIYQELEILKPNYLSLDIPTNILK